MKRELFTSVIFFIAIITAAQAQDRSVFVGWNLPAVYNRSADILVQKVYGARWSAEISGGYVFHAKVENPKFSDDTHLFYKRKGGFLRVGLNYAFRRDASKPAAFVGLHLVNAYVIEDYLYVPLGVNPAYVCDVSRSKSFNLGTVMKLGLMSSSVKPFGFDVGIQSGVLPVNRLASVLSYMPGMGVCIGRTFFLQGFLNVKYRLQ